MTDGAKADENITYAAICLHVTFETSYALSALHTTVPVLQ